MTDPLSPEALALVPEVKEAGLAYDRFLQKHGDPATFEGGGSPSEAYYERLGDLFEDVLAAVRDAVLKAERERVAAVLLGDGDPDELVEALKGWALSRENVEDCYCEGGEGTCWYHLPPEAKKASRIASLLEWLDDRGGVR